MMKKLTDSWKLFWPIQAAVMLIVALCSTLLPLAFPSYALPLRVVFLWILPSLAGAWTACILSRSGLNSYLAWLVPPIVHSVVPWIVLGYLPSPFSMLLCAFISLTGAATGEVMRRRDER